MFKESFKKGPRLGHEGNCDRLGQPRLAKPKSERSHLAQKGTVKNLGIPNECHL